MFQVLDTDNDGHITEEELKSVFNDDFDPKAYIAEFDYDGDNKISLKEFISVLTQVRKQDITVGSVNVLVRLWPQSCNSF